MSKRPAFKSELRNKIVRLIRKRLKAKKLPTP